MYYVAYDYVKDHVWSCERQYFKHWISAKLFSWFIKLQNKSGRVDIIEF